MHAAGISDLAEQIRTRPLLLDGAMGTELQARGLAPGTPPEVWTVERPEAVMAVHQAYLEAGSDLILTNTFGANRLRLAAYGAAHRVVELNEVAVELALSVAALAFKQSAKVTWVGGSMGPCGSPHGRKATFAQAVEVFGEQARALARAGCSLIVLETMTDLGEVEAAVAAVREEAPEVPVIAMMTFGRDGRLPAGEGPEAVAARLDRLPLCGLGANCSFGPEGLLPVVERMAAVTRFPLAAKPNAGVPAACSVAVFAEWGERLVQAGAQFIGGCCGTTPAHIRSLAARLSLTTSPGPEQRLGGGGGAPTRQARAGETAAASWAECGGAAARAPSVGHRRRPGAAKSQGEEVSWT